MNDLANYCSQEQTIKELKAKLDGLRARNNGLTRRLKKKADIDSVQRNKSINIAYALGRGHLVVQIASDLNVSTATITKANKQINYKGRKQ